MERIFRIILGVGWGREGLLTLQRRMLYQQLLEGGAELSQATLVKDVPSVGGQMCNGLLEAR